MPVCFQLFRRTADGKTEKEPAVLPRVDDEICRHMGVEPHDVNYYCSWFNYIGFKLATGQKFQEIRNDIQELIDEDKAAGADPDNGLWVKMMQILDYIEAHYDSRSWWEPRSLSRDA